MELRHIRYFLAVADELNFTRAAAKVGIAQPPLSQQIQDLEEELGMPLFQRLSRGVKLTPAGQAFLPEARAILALTQRARKTARLGELGEVGRLRIGFTSSASFCPLVPATLRAFKSKYPNVELSLEEADTTRLLDQLKKQNIDAAFVRPGGNESADLHFHILANEPMVIALPSTHPLARSTPLSLSALRKEPFLLFPRKAGIGWFDEIIAACRKTGFEPVMGQEVPQISSVGNLVAAEFGVSVVPESIASQVKIKGVCYVKIKGHSPIARLALAARLDEKASVVHNFVAMAIVARRGG